jgi:hypothetical protein
VLFHPAFRIELVILRQISSILKIASSQNDSAFALIENTNFIDSGNPSGSYRKSSKSRKRIKPAVGPPQPEPLGSPSCTRHSEAERAGFAAALQAAICRGMRNPGRWPGLFCSSPSGCIFMPARFHVHKGRPAEYEYEYEHDF